MAIEENGERREPERHGGEDCPEFLVGWNPARNRSDGETKIKNLSEREGDGGETESETHEFGTSEFGANDLAERARRCGVGGGRSVKGECSAEYGKLFEEVRVRAIRGGRFDDGRNAGEQKTAIDKAKDDRGRAGGTRDQDAEAAGDLKGHEAEGDHDALRKFEELVKGLPGFGVVP